MREDLLQYWRNPSDGLNDPVLYYRADGWIRSGHLTHYLKNKMQLPIIADILEIGCGVGRNLAVLKYSGYTCLTGVEISELGIKTMREHLPVLQDVPVLNDSVENVLPVLKDDAFDLLFTMAVLEHLPTSSEFVFKHLVRVTRQYLLTIEDEHCTSWRHFPRDYRKVFEPLGMKQVDEQKNLPTLSRGFRLRLFVKEVV